MLFSFSTKDQVAPLKSSIAAFVCLAIAATFVFIAATDHTPGQLFPFVPSAVALAGILWGIMCIVQPSAEGPRASESQSAIVGLVVAIPTCLILTGVILEANTQGIGWHQTPALVSAVTSRDLGGRHARLQYTVHYQYTWQNTTFNGATITRGQPSLTTWTSRSLQSRPLAAHDKIRVSVNPEQPNESFYPQDPPLIIYPVFLLFAWLGWSSYRRLRKPPKQGVFNP